MMTTSEQESSNMHSFGLPVELDTNLKKQTFLNYTVKGKAFPSIR
jgi:hypothetical protein